MEFQSFLNFDDIEPSKLTPVLKEYYEIKNQYKDFIVLFQVGSFFETYFNDAVTFSAAVGITLTSKKFLDKKVQTAGIPVKKIDIFVEKLLKDNLKIALVEQFKDENGNIERKVTRTYTKGTLFESEFLNKLENNYIMAIYKEKTSYNIAYSDISTGSLFVSTGNLEELKCELSRLNPVELLVSKGVEKFLFETFKTEILDEKFFIGENENKGLNALINYSKFILKEYVPKLENPICYKIQTNLLMDFLTRKNLEITKNAFNNKRKGSLLWALDRCKTPMGKRLLSNFISTPLFNIDEIKSRQNAISGFLNNEKIAENLGKLLENIGDISRLTSRMSNSTITPLEFLTVKEGLKNLEEIEKLTKKLNTEFLNQKTETNTLFDYFEILDKVLEDDIERIKEGNFIKKGANSDLDILLIEKEKLQTELETYEKSLQGITGIQKLQITRKSGNYSIEISNSAINPLGADFRLIQKLKSTSKYTTDKLISLEEKIFSTEAKITETKNHIFKNLKEFSCEMTDKIRKYSDKIAKIDVIYSLYKISKEENLICPKINTEGEFRVKEGKHLTAEKLFENFDPLDIDFDGKNLIMLTGKNGSGKSTYLKQIATTIILAQAGCFVPSKYAEMPLFDKLFTVLNISDELINKKSAHQAQMKEIARITENISDKSIVLLDETGKNTSYKDGISITYGIIKYLTEKTKAKTVLSTHFSTLLELTENIKEKISYLEIKTAENKRIITKGTAKESEGINCALIEDIPVEIINYAKEVKNLV